MIIDNYACTLSALVARLDKSDRQGKVKKFIWFGHGGTNWSGSYTTSRAANRTHLGFPVHLEFSAIPVQNSKPLNKTLFYSSRDIQCDDELNYHYRMQPKLLMSPNVNTYVKSVKVHRSFRNSEHKELHFMPSLEDGPRQRANYT